MLTNLFIILLEGDSEWCRILGNRLPPEVELECVQSFAQAIEVKQNHRRVDAIVIGDGVSLDAQMVKQLRAIYPGPIIAGSAHDGINQTLILAGCDHRVRTKVETAQVVTSILRMQTRS